jgi:hypothetical protein
VSFPKILSGRSSDLHRTARGPRAAANTVAARVLEMAARLYSTGVTKEMANTMVTTQRTV